MEQNTAYIAQVSQRLKKLYTAAVYDILDKMGLPNQCRGCILAVSSWSQLPANTAPVIGVS